MTLENFASATPGIGTQNYSNVMIPSEDLGLSLMFLVSGSKAGSGSALPEYLLEAVDLAPEQFNQFSASPNLDHKMNLIFDQNWDRQAFQKVVQDVEQSGFRNLVEIDVLTGIQLGGANAVFAEETNTIYFSEDFLLKNASNPEAITAVFHEEFGHWIDSKINTFDASGDEGELFQKVVQNQALNADDLFVWKTENDHSTIILDGKTLSIEMSNSDFDGDGKSDILWRNNNGQIGTWLMNGSSVKAGVNIGTPVGQEWQIESVGDFDGDGKSDILWRNSNGQIGTWLMNGSSVKAGANIGNPVGQEWQIKSVGDFDGDGKSDILWRNSNGQVGTWLMNGSSVKAGVNIGNPVGQEWQIQGTNAVHNTTLAPTPKGNLEEALRFTLKWEGGYVNHPNDPGGATNKGITQNTYNGYRSRLGLSLNDVRYISDAEVQNIYRQNYWLASNSDKLSSKLAIAHFDASVNHGTGNSKWMLEKALAAGGDENNMVRAYLNAREQFYRNIIASNSSMKVFWNGWMNRLNDLRSTLLG